METHRVDAGRTLRSAVQRDPYDGQFSQEEVRDIPAMPPVRVRAGRTVYDIASLDEALAFVRANPYPKGDMEGLVRRLQSADTPDDVLEAGNAFLWWAQSNGVLVTPRHPA